MESCPTCCAKVYPGQSWCGQCFASWARDPTTPAETVEACEPGIPGSSPLAARMPPPADPMHLPTYSRWRGGPTSFGLVGRILLTLLALVLGLIGYPMMRGLVVASVGLDVPGSGFMLMYGGVALLVELYALSRIWKRERIA